MSKRDRFDNAVLILNERVQAIAHDLEGIARKTADLREKYMLEGIAARLRKESKDMDHEIRLYCESKPKRSKA
jgi:hypothetical protein